MPKINFISTGPVCEICGKIFTELRNLVQHRRTIHKNPDTFSCTECNYATPRKSSLNRHMKRHASAPITSSHPPKVACRKAHINDSPSNNLLLVQSTQCGSGPSPTDVPDEVHRFFQGEQPWGTDQNLCQVYNQNFHRIRDSQTLNRKSRIYLRYLNHSFPLIDSIVHAIENIFQHQTNAFKINLSFSFILQHRETGEFRYHYASNNNQLLNTSRLIRNQQDLNNLLNFLVSQDFPSHLKDQRPNTKWVIERIVSLRIHLVMTTCPLGKPPKLPDYIKNNRHIIALEKDENTAKSYKDHLCFFRCLAIAKFGKAYHNCNQKAKDLFNQYCFHFRVNPEEFKGVELSDFPQLEKYHETQLFAMFLKEDGSAKTLYLSQASFPKKIYLNVYQNHLSLITDHKMYSKQYICSHCDKLFPEMRNFMQHQPKCDFTVKYVFPGGVYKNKLSVFEELEGMGVRVREEDKYEKWFACYDFEAYQQDFCEGVDQMEELDSEEGTSWNKVHVPVSFSVGCNLEGVDTYHVSSKDPEELTSKLVGTLLEMVKKKYEACVERYEYIFEQLERLKVREVVRLQEDMDDDDLEMDESGGVSSKHLKLLENLFSKFEGYCKELAVFGFNSAGYDLKLIKKFLFKEFFECSQEPIFTVKKAGKYPCIKTEHLKFIDILQFLAPGYNLKSFFYNLKSLWCFRAKRFLSIRLLCTC